MDFKTIIVVVLGIAVVSWFTPTPMELQDRFKSGQDYYASRDYHRAIEQFDVIIDSESGLLEEDSIRVSLLNNEINVGVRSAAYYQKGNAFRSLGMTDSAITYYRIVERREDSPKLSALSQYQIYEIFYAGKDYASAITEARTLFANHPASEKVPQALYDIGWCFRELKMLDSSDTAFEDLIKRFPQHELDPRARYQVGENYFEEKKWEHAIEEFRGLIDKYRPESFAKSEWENVELKALRDKKLFEAASSHDVDLSTLELTAKAQVRIGDVFRERGMFDSAIINYHKVIGSFSLMPSLVEATYIKMAEYTTQHSGIDEGIAVYQDAIDESFSNKPLQAKLQYKIARTYQEQKLFSKAAAAYLFYARTYPGEADAIKFPVEQAMFLAVSCHFNAREYVQTITFADSTLVMVPETELRPKLLLYKGLSQSALFRYADARATYQAVIVSGSESDESVIAKTQLGKTYLDEKSYTLAVKEFEGLLSGDRSRLDVSEVEYFLGLSYYGLNEHASAIQHLGQVESSSSYYPYTFARITRAYASQKDFTGATAYLRRADSTAIADSSSHRPFIRLAHAELLSAQQEYPAAVEQFNSVLSDSSLTENTRMQALYGRGTLYVEMTKHQQAVTDLKTCLSSAVFTQVFPALVPQAKEKMAFSLVQVGKKKEATDVVNELVAHSTSDQEQGRFLATLTELYFRAGDEPQTIATAQRVIALKDADEQSLVRAYVTLGNCYGNQQQHAKAIATLNEATDRFPRNDFLEDTYYHLGLLYYNGGDYGNAAEVLNTFLQKYDTSASRQEVEFFHAMSVYHTGQADESIRLLRRFLRQYPASNRAPEAQLQIAEAYFNTNRFDDAARDYQVVYQQYSNNENAPLAMLNEGWSFFQAGKPDRMIELFRKLAEKYPQAPVAADAAFSIGDYYYNNKVYDSALVAYTYFADRFADNARVEEARGLIHELGQVEAYREYEAAMAYFDAKNWRIAAEELTKVMEKYPETDVVYGCKANVASSYAQLGDRQRALQMFNEIIEQWKDVEPAKPAVFFAELHKRWIEAGK